MAFISPCKIEHIFQSPEQTLVGNLNELIMDTSTGNSPNLPLNISLNNGQTSPQMLVQSGSLNGSLNHSNAFSDSDGSAFDSTSYSSHGRRSNNNSFSSLSSNNSNNSNSYSFARTPRRNNHQWECRQVPQLDSSYQLIQESSEPTWTYSPELDYSSSEANSPQGYRSPQGYHSPQGYQSPPGHRSPMGNSAKNGSCSPLEIVIPQETMNSRKLYSPPQTDSSFGAFQTIWQKPETEQFVDFNRNNVNFVRYCKKHYMHLNLYCMTCSEVACLACMEEAHKEHKCLELSLAIDTEVRRCEEIKREAMSTGCFLETHESEVQAMIVKLDKNKYYALETLRSRTKELIELILMNESKLKAKIDDVHKQNVKYLSVRSAKMIEHWYQLSQTIGDLGRAVNNANKVASPLDLNEIQSTSLSRLYGIRQDILKAKENSTEYIIEFQPNAELFNYVRSKNFKIGTANTESPGAVGGHRKDVITETYLRMISMAPMRRGLGQVLPGSLRSLAATLPKGNDNPLPILEIGNNVPEAQRLCRPWGVACAPDGRIFVADRSNNRIVVYSEEGEQITEFGSHGSGAGQFDRPAGIAIDSRKRLIIVDKDNHRVQVMTMEGKYLFMFGQKGSENGQFNYPWDVAVNTDCQIVVSDTRNHRIQMFGPQGDFLRKFGFDSLESSGSWKSFDSPRGVTFNQHGDVFLTDFNNHRLVRVDSEFVKHFNVENKTGPLTFCRPQGLLIDDYGNYIIADSKNCQIVVYNAKRELINVIGMQGQNLGELDRPSGMALTPKGRLAIVDFGNNRVVVY